MADASGPSLKSMQDEYIILHEVVHMGTKLLARMQGVAASLEAVSLQEAAGFSTTEHPLDPSEAEEGMQKGGSGWNLWVGHDMCGLLNHGVWG